MQRCGHAAVGLSLLVWAAAVNAQLNAAPYASEAVENDSNVFRFENTQVATTANGGVPFTQLSDTLFRSTLGLIANYDFGQQQVYAAGEGRRVDYEHFTTLDNTAYLWYGGLNYKLAQFLDGVIEHRQERVQEPFENRNSTLPEEQAEYNDRATANFAVTPDWRLETGATYRSVDSPQADAPNFGLHEASYRTAIRYLGLGKLTGGLEGHYANGSYNGEFEQSSDSTYFERGVGLTAEEKISGLSSINGNVDYTRRTNEGDGSSKFSGVTGQLAYERKISAKTDFDIHLYRRTSSYNVAASTVLETGAGLGLIWTPTQKIKATLRYDYSSDRYQGLDTVILTSTDPDTGITTVTTVSAPDRKDHLNLATANLSYDILSWLNALAYFDYSDRDSNTQDFAYRDHIVGLQLTLKYRHGTGL